MRILYVAAGIDVPGDHGGSVHAAELARALVRVGHEVHLVALPGDSPGTQLQGVHLHTLRPVLRLEQAELLRAPQVRRIAERVRPDVVLERFYTFGGTGVLAARRLGVPVVLEVNSPAWPYPGSLRDRLDALTLIRPVHRWRRWMLDRAAAFVPNAAVLMADSESDRTTVIGCGVDAASIRPGDVDPRSGPLRCIYMSSFRPWHGAEDLVRATDIAVRAGADLRVTLLGAGPRLEAARALARDSAAAERIEFTGRVPHADIPRYLAAAHVGVAPYDPGGNIAMGVGFFWTPIKIFEYLAAGLAVVTIDVPELRDMLPPPVAAFHAPGDPQALAGVLQQLDADRDRVARAGAAARRLAEERYTWDALARRLGAVLERVIGAPGR